MGIGSTLSIEMEMNGNGAVDRGRTGRFGITRSAEEEKAIVTPRSIAVVPRHAFVTGLIICLFVLVIHGILYP